MAWDNLPSDHAKHDRDQWIGVYIALLAVILALCSMGGSNATKEATLKHIEAANTWAFFQAKNIRRQVIRLEIDEFETMRDGTPGMTPEAKAALDAKITGYREQEKQLTSDDKGEGLDELFQKGKALEADRDVAMHRDPYFDYATAFLQIAIVLASVAIISGGATPLVASVIIGIAGALLTINGYTLAVSIPFIG